MHPRRRGLSAALLIAAPLLGSACDKKPSAPPPPPSGLPPLAGVDKPAPRNDFPAHANYDKGAQALSGELRVDAKLKDRVAPGDTIYLMVRTAENAGPPLWVKKLSVGTEWPLAFTLDGSNAMIQGVSLPPKATLSARIDKDGDALTKNPGDLVGLTPVEPPAKNVVLTFDKVL